MNRKWKESNHYTYYYYQEEDGLIIGQVHKVTHTSIWISKIDETSLGQYIDLEYAKKSLEQYYDIHDRTLIEW